MAETLDNIVKEAKKIKYSPTRKLTEDDIIFIWESASSFVEKQMLQQKGVAFPGLGVFTFSQKKIDVGNNKFITIQRPVFALSEKVAQTHSLHINKQHTSGQIPIVPLNFTCLSNDSPFSRDVVEISIKDILLALSRALAAKKNIQLDFGKIGRLLITEGRVKMRFFRQFIVSLDTSGGIENAFRPNTTCSTLSLMSNPSTPRTSTAAPILPRIVEPSADDSLSLECTTPRRHSESMPTTPRTHDWDLSIDPDDSVSQRGRPSSNTEKLAPLKTSSSGRHTLVPKPATLFSTSDHPLAQNQLYASYPGAQPSSVNRSRPTSAGSCKSTASKKAEKRHSSSQLTNRPSTCSHSNPSGQELCYLCHQRALRNVTMDTLEERREKEKAEEEMFRQYQYQKDLVELAKEVMVKSKNRAYNQEIASSNMQAAEIQQASRTAKSSEFHPSYVFPHREATPARYLKQVEYCGQLDSQVEYVQNQKQKIQQLEEKLEKDEQTKLSEELAKYQKEYSKRKTEKMLQYQRALAEQVAIKQELISIWGKDYLCNISDSSVSVSEGKPRSPVSSGKLRLRPLSLPKPTTVSPFSHSKPLTIFKDCNIKMVSMKSTNPLTISAEIQQQPLFGVDTVGLRSEDLRDQKERARKLFIEQLRMAAAKQKLAKERAVIEKLEGAEMLKQTRKGLIDDIRADRRRKHDTRKTLEMSWDVSAIEKQELAAKDEVYNKQPSLLVQEQCDKYVRCKQCQRTRDNKGKSNLLSESRYTSGARLMV